MEKAEKRIDAAMGMNAAGGIAMAARERTREECGIEEKVERMRDTLLRVERVIDLSHKRANEALQTAKVHGHSPMGEVMVPTAKPYLHDEIQFDVRHVFHRLR